MNAVFVWVGFPIGIALILFLFQRWKQVITIVGTSITLLLAGVAWLYPANNIMRLGPLTVEIIDHFSFYGSQIALTHADRPLLVLLYLMAAFWFLGSLAANVPAHFVPFGMVAVPILIASIFIKPFFYAALLFEFVALLFIVLLSVPGKPPTKGILRFMVFQILGMLFIVFASLLLRQINIENVDMNLLAQFLIVMGLGFSLLLGIFPFLTWIPMVAGQNEPYLTAFMLNILLNSIMLFGLRFLDQYGWFQDYVEIQTIFQVVGAIMLGAGGVWAAFQRDLGRMMGYVVIVEIGRSLLAFSLGRDGSEIYFALLIIQICALGIWALSLSIIYARLRNLDYHAVAGIARQLPLPVVGIFLGHFSLAGLPLFAGFPLYWALGSQLIAQAPLWITSSLLLGSIGLLGGGLRSVSVLLISEEEAPVVAESSTLSTALLLFGGVFLGILGLMPHYLVKFVESTFLVFR